MTVAPQTQGWQSLRVAILASAGSAIEWYDFFIYGTAAALVFPKLFFPADLPPFVAQIASFSIFAVGFIARPAGGLLFGHLGDTHGRKHALVLAMLVMGLSTTLIGLLPTYATLGIAAPLLLIVLRFVQGLAVGGQWGGAALLAIESAPPGKQGFYGSFVQVGVPLGVLLANAVFLAVSALTNDTDFMNWGWRIGFVLSVGLIAIGGVVHVSIVEPGADHVAVDAREVTKPGRAPILAVLREHWRVVLLAGGAFIANNVCFYIAITYAVAHGSTTLGIDRKLLLLTVMAGSAIMMPTLLACGAASDRFGRRGVFLAGAFLSGLWAFAVFPLLEMGGAISVVCAIAVQLSLVSMMYGPQAALFAELFPKSVRYSGASLGYQVGAVLGGGLAPIIATALFAHYRSSLPISIYLATMCAVSFVSLLFLRRRTSTPLAD